ncbi:MAG: MlaD family protein [Mediterranea sp.]|nr:MlaD family protein [Mediterranea sp.]
MIESKIKQIFTKEVRIGITGIVSLFILIYGINYLKGINLFKPACYFYVKYTNIYGLTVSSPVFADGYKIGLVHDIHYDYNNPGNVVVVVELDTHARIPKGSWAELQNEMLGSVKMNLMLVNNPRESYAIGDTIPGKENKDMTASVSALLPQVEQMLPKLDSILTSLNRILGDENIPATLQSIRNTTANLEVSTAQLNTLMRRDIPRLTAKMNTIGDNFITISDNLKGIDLDATFSKIDSTLYNVKLITEKLNRKDNSVGLLLNDPDFYNKLNATANNAASLLEDIQAHPKRYVHFSLFGRKNKTK